jgi:hypothetical protein
VQGLKPDDIRTAIASPLATFARIIFLLSPGSFFYCQTPGLESNFPKSHLSAGQLKHLFLVTFHLFLFVFLLFALPDR